MDLQDDYTAKWAFETAATLIEIGRFRAKDELSKRDEIIYLTALYITIQEDLKEALKDV